MNKKKILVLAIAVCMLAILSFSTLAWFHASDEVTNQFLFADSDCDQTPDFSVDVKEKVPGCLPGATDVGNVYRDILPGQCLEKVATVTNTGDYDQWLRVHITFSDSAAWQKAIEKAAAAAGLTFDEFVMDRLLIALFDWVCEEPPVVTFDAFGEDTMTYTFYVNHPVKPYETLMILGGVKIPDILNQEDMNFGDDGFTMKIKAEALQVDNLDAASASAAFAKVGWEIGSSYGE